MASPQTLRDAIARFPGARVVAIDAGAEVAAKSDVRPDAVVGDMDSVRPETLEALRAQACEVHVHPPRKRDTDAALALALVPAAEDVVFVGSGGGRADHALANLHLLASREGSAHAIDDDATTWIASPTRPLTLHETAGTVVSVLPFDSRCDGVTLEGMEYALNAATMLAGDPYGISNVCLAPPQRVRVHEGRLVVIIPRGDAPR